jgi:hypothetical protein
MAFEAPRILLFGHPGSGKSSLLGALQRAGETQGERLGAEVFDPTGRLPRIRDHLYSGGEFHNTHTELVTYELSLRPWQPGTGPSTVIIHDCDGNAANALLKHPDPITERRVRGTVASAVVESDLIALVISAAADDRELDRAFDEFLMFLERVHGRKAFLREVGGFPIRLVLTQCDTLVEAGGTKDEWEAEVRERLQYAVNRFEDFLEDHQPKAEEESPFLPFGSVDLKGFATAIHGLEGNEPVGVAEFFRNAFAAAAEHRSRDRTSQRLLRRTLSSVVVAVWLLLAGAVGVSLYQPRPADPGLADRVQAYWEREPPAAVRLAGKNLTRNRNQLATFQTDAGFFALPDHLKQFVAGRLHEIEDYEAYRKKLDATPSPAESRSLEELAQVEAKLNGELALPAEYTWGETEAAKLRDKWLADVPLIRSAEGVWQEWYRGLANQALALSLVKNFEGNWRDRVAALANPQAPFDVAAAISGSPSVPLPRGERVTYRVPAEFDRVYQAQKDWEFQHARLEHLRDLADALGLTSDTSRRALDIQPGTDPGRSLKQYQSEFADASRHWNLANFPEPARSALAAKVHESVENGARLVRILLRNKLSGDTPDGWRKLASELTDPTIRDWGKLLHALMKLENPQAIDPVSTLFIFLRSGEYWLELKALDVTIPLALRVPAIVPAGPLTITVTPPTGPPSTYSFKLVGEGTSQGLATVYQLAPESKSRIPYQSGDSFKIELPVRSGDQRFTLTWDDGPTRTFQFDRLTREPKLVPATGASEPATGVTLTPAPGSTVPRFPLLLPDVKR